MPAMKIKKPSVLDMVKAGAKKVDTAMMKRMPTDFQKMHKPKPKKAGR